MRLPELLAGTAATTKDATVNSSALDIDQRVRTRFFRTWCRYLLLLIRRTNLWRTNWGHGATAIDTTINCTIIHLNQCPTGNGAWGIATLVLTILAIMESSDTRTCTKYITASALISCCSLTFNRSLEYPYFSTVAYMSVLTTTIERTVDSGTICANSSSFCSATEVDEGVIHITQEEVGQILITRWELTYVHGRLTTTTTEDRTVWDTISISARSFCSYSTT